jgi:RNA polymerase sigma-70 factor, ECF subfamily
MRADLRARASFEDFFIEQGGCLMAQAYALTGNVQDAQDLVQEVMIRTWQRWRRVSRLEHPAAWARRVLINLAVDRWRTKSRHQVLVDTTASLPPPGIGHIDVARELRRLPRQQRTAVVLHDIVGLTTTEVAREMKAPEGSVRGWLSRGRRALAERLQMTPENIQGERIK